MVIGLYGYLLGCMVIGLYGYLLGCMVIWLYGCMVVWLFVGLYGYFVMQQSLSIFVKRPRSLCKYKLHHKNHSNPTTNHITQ
jgi:hypothetical protein